MDLELEKIMNFIKNIPDVVFEGNQPEFLYNLNLSSTANGAVVEIGTNVGKSTISLAFAQKRLNGGPIYAVDIYEHPKIKQNLQTAGISNFVKRINSPSIKLAKKWKKPIKLLFIDGDHSYLGVKNDIKYWSPHLVEGGLLVLHDYPGHRKSMEVWRAVNKYLFRNPYNYKLISDREAGSLIVFKKISLVKPAGFKLKIYLFWQYRNLRTILVQSLPGLAITVKKLMLKKEVNE